MLAAVDCMVSSNDSETLSELLEQRVLLLSLNAFGQPANLPLCTHTQHAHKSRGRHGGDKVRRGCHGVTGQCLGGGGDELFAFPFG